jgi:hypothetical protein
MTAVFKRASDVRAVRTRELHPIIKRIIEAMVADIIAEEDQAKNPTCLSESDDQQ